MASNESGATAAPPQTRWKMSESCRAGDCFECVAYFSDGAVHYRSGLRLSRTGNGR
jgi:hypothetical protein